MLDSRTPLPFRDVLVGLSRERLRAGGSNVLGRARGLEQRVIGGLRGRRSRRSCEHCGAWLDRRGQCSSCGRSRRLGASEWVALVADGGSFRALSALVEADPLQYEEGGRSYPELLSEARQRTGLEESVAAGFARIGGTDVALAAFDFGFLGGSVGVAAGDRITAALAAAARERVPAVLVVCSSGARMQEGLPSLYQMLRTSTGVLELRRAGLPLVSVLADPTTGAIYASCASLADVIVAERRALVNFAGPRVVEAVTGERGQVMRAEELFARGIVDSVVSRADLASTLADLLRLLVPRRAVAPGEPIELPRAAAPPDRWALLQEVRDPGWATGSDWLFSLASRVFVLHGDRTGEDDPALVCALAEIEGTPLLCLASDRRAGSGLITAAGYRKARRTLAMAARLRLPVVTLVDGPGAAVGRTADESGIAGALAECLAALLDHPAPTVAILVGEGSSGGAVALVGADRIFMLEHSTFSVISPEGAVAILDRLGRPPSAMADVLRIAAADAYELGLVDGVLPSHGGARRQTRQARRLLAQEVAGLGLLAEDDLQRTRRRRYLESTRHLLRAIGPEPGYPRKEDAA